MGLPSSGSLSMSQVRAELKKSGSINLNNGDVRQLARKPSGTIRMSDLRGKEPPTWVFITDIYASKNSNDKALQALREDVRKATGYDYNFAAREPYKGEYKFGDKYKIIFSDVRRGRGYGHYVGKLYEFK